MHAFLHCLSSYNYIVKSGAIDVSQFFLVIESLFYDAISRPCHLSEFCPNRAWSAIILAAQAPSALVASAHSVHVLTTAFPCSHLLCLAFGLCICPHPPPFYFSSDKSVSRVDVSVGVGVNGWKAQVYQPWRCNFIYGLALSKMEASGRSGYPPPQVAQLFMGLLVL